MIAGGMLETWKRKETMFEWSIWIAYQIVTTAALFAWYAKKHPDEAKKMFMKWRNLF